MYPDSKAYGGTAFIIRSNIKQYEIGKFQTEFLQATSIAVEDRSSCITISAIYSSPKHTIKKKQYINFLKCLVIDLSPQGTTMPNTHAGDRD